MFIRRAYMYNLFYLFICEVHVHVALKNSSSVKTTPPS